MIRTSPVSRSFYAALAVVGLASTALVTGAGPVSAAVTPIVVDDGGDVSLPDGVTTLREAIAAAANGDTIVFDPSVTAVVLTQGPLELGNDLVIGDAAVAPADRVVVSTGAGFVGDNIFAVTGNNDATIAGVTLEAAPVREAIFATLAKSLTLNNIRVVSGTQSGVRFEVPAVGVGEGGDLSIISSEIDAGGPVGVAVDGADEVSIVDTSVTNHSFRGVGVSDARVVSVMGSDMSDNDTENLNITDVALGVSVSDSTLSGSEDGLILDNSGVDGDLVRATMRENDRGVSMHGGNSLTIRQSTFVGNRFEPITVTAGVLTLENSTVTGNNTGGFATIAATGQAVVRHSTITGNNAADSTFLIGTFTIDHSVVTGNGAASFTNSGASVTVMNSLVPSGNSAAGTNGNIGVDDPMLGALADNGGLTETMRPLAGSPAIDAGDAAVVTAPPTDQRGLPRQVGTIDIGAVEVAAGALSVTAEASAIEGDGTVDVTVTRTGGSDGAVSAQITSFDDTALAGDDFVAVDELVEFADGDSDPKTVTITLTDDDVVESDEMFTLTLVGDEVDTDNDTSTVTITDDDIEVPPAEPGDAVTSLEPVRFVDTRANGATVDDLFEAEGKRTADSEYQIDIAGRGDVPVDAKAAIINVTAVAPEALGFFTVHPCEDERPLASSLNYTDGVNMANEIVAPLSADGEICIYTSQAAHVIVDVDGFVAGDSPTVPVTPARYLDTRETGETFDDGDQGAGRQAADSVTELTVAGRGGVPADAEAVIVNVTAVNPSGNGFVTVFSCTDEVPEVSSLNYTAGVSRANEVIAPVGADGDICLLTSNEAHLLVDVVGYISIGSTFNAVEPTRLLNTRTTDKPAADSELTVQVAGEAGVPAGASAAVVNVTAVQADDTGFVTAHPCSDPRPTASSLNYVAGVNGANELIAPLDADGNICLYTSASAHLLVDVVAYFD